MGNEQEVEFFRLAPEDGCGATLTAPRVMQPTKRRQREQS